MKKCKTCGNECYDNAVICPKCGCSVKTSKIKKIIKYFFWGFLGLVIFGMVITEIRTENLRKTNPYIDQIDQWDGSHYELTRIIKSNLKDPSSFQHIKTEYIIGDKTIVVQTDYRAKNSFGGYMVGSFRAEFDKDGNIIPKSLVKLQ